MKFIVIPRSQSVPQTGVNEVYLKIDRWNDYSFVTMFDVSIFDESGIHFDLGSVKIGFIDQTVFVDTYSILEAPFETLSETFFSLGQDETYYRTLRENLSIGFREAFLLGLRDIVFDNASYKRASGQDVFRVSLLRSVSISTVNGQFRRILDGGAPLSDFDFGFNRPQTDIIAGIDLSFVVTANSTSSTNIHAIIGRNGVGKTTLLNEMIAAIMRPNSTQAEFYINIAFQKEPIDPTYFSSLVSVAFSAFDPFNPPQEQPDPERGTCYYYVGLKDIEDDTGILLKSLPIMRHECVASLAECFSDQGRKERWRTAISILESDENFARMNLNALADLTGKQLKITAEKLVNRMSSGQASSF